MNYIKSDPNLYISMSKPVVFHESFIEIPGYGKVSASFDFSELDSKAHQMAINHISQSAKRIHLPISDSQLIKNEQKLLNGSNQNIGLLGRFFKRVGFYKLFGE